MTYMLTYRSRSCALIGHGLDFELHGLRDRHKRLSLCFRKVLIALSTLPYQLTAIQPRFPICTGFIIIVTVSTYLKTVANTITNAMQCCLSCSSCI